MESFLTATCVHKNNPTGAALATVASNIPCTPVDAATELYGMEYPMDKLFLLHETFTEYVAFQPGDYLVAGGVTYAVKSVNAWAAQGGMSAYYHILVEKQSGS
jgi:hypothetical protein